MGVRDFRIEDGLRVYRFTKPGKRGVSYTASMRTSGGNTQIPGAVKATQEQARLDLIERLVGQGYEGVARKVGEFFGMHRKPKVEVTRHAPSPWSLRLLENGHPIIEDECGNKVIEQFCNGGTSEGSEARDNARLIASAPRLATLLRRILGMHESDNCGAYNGEAVLSESVADEIRDVLQRAGIKADDWSREVR